MKKEASSWRTSLSSTVIASLKEEWQSHLLYAIRSPRRLWLLAMTVGVIFLPTSITTMASPSTNTPVKIALEWFLNPHHAPFIIAQTNGYFADENLDVTFYPANGSQEGCRQALQGSVDFAITHEPQVLIFAANGMPLETVAVIIPETLEVILSTIPLDQLKGKTVAHGSSGAGSLTFAVMHQFLKNRGLTEGDVTIIMAKNCLVTGFITGTIDVVFNLYRTYQLHDIKKHMKRPFFVHELKDFGVPSFASMVLVCGAAVPAEVRLKMTRALQKAVDFIHANPDAAYECVRRHRAELDTLENKDVWPSVRPIFAKDVTSRPSTAELKDFLADAGVM
jgi:putative hydroxymethylpyrimidine transport system substrate-binding protein